MELLQSVAGFFHEEVKEALKVQKVEVEPGTEFYLVNLLSEFTSTPVDESPLSLKLAEAQHQLGEARLRRLKEVGDTSLYMTGFFAESLARKLVDVDFYMSLGGSAYRQLATTHTVTQMAPVYRELAARFAQMVSVFAEIRQRTAIAGAGSDLGRLYSEWRRTGNPVLERRLHELGMLMPIAANEDN
jgi:hypothetical protein